MHGWVTEQTCEYTNEATTSFVAIWNNKWWLALKLGGRRNSCFSGTHNELQWATTHKLLLWEKLKTNCDPLMGKLNLRNSRDWLFNMKTTYILSLVQTKFRPCLSGSRCTNWKLKKRVNKRPKMKSKNLLLCTSHKYIYEKAMHKKKFDIWSEPLWVPGLLFRHNCPLCHKKYLHQYYLYILLCMPTRDVTALSPPSMCKPVADIVSLSVFSWHWNIVVQIAMATHSISTLILFAVGFVLTIDVSFRDRRFFIQGRKRRRNHGWTLQTRDV